jgi:DNA-binding NarL/FixJ family response regulator
MEKIKLLLADDHRIILNGLQVMLNDEPDISVVGEVCDRAEALAFVRQNPDIDVILMDVRMPNMNGITATREILKLYPNINVLGLSMFQDDEFITEMVNAGAKGYLLKHAGKLELLDAIRRVARGEPYFGQEVMQLVLNKVKGTTNPVNLSPASIPPLETQTGELTEREMEILALIAAQMTNQEIADKLFISPRTVHSHRRNLMQKLGAKNTAGLVRQAIEMNLFSNKN